MKRQITGVMAAVTCAIYTIGMQSMIASAEEISYDSGAVFSAYPAGDANLDGKADVRDCSYIARQLSIGEQSALPDSADYNGDGVKNIRDAAELAAYIAGNIQNIVKYIYFDKNGLLIVDPDIFGLTPDEIAEKLNKSDMQLQSNGYYSQYALYYIGSKSIELGFSNNKLIGVRYTSDVYNKNVYDAAISMYGQSYEGYEYWYMSWDLGNIIFSVVSEDGKYTEFRQTYSLK
ncbi:MAG: dockerin type I domain-containing protein [Porcipelethomonas sp.]